MTGVSKTLPVSCAMNILPTTYMFINEDTYRLKCSSPARPAYHPLDSLIWLQVFTIQFIREFSRLGLTKAVGGVLSLAFW
eukprot:1190944-Prorocentrum_minimum.AAC.4